MFGGRHRRLPGKPNGNRGECFRLRIAHPHSTRKSGIRSATPSLEVVKALSSTYNVSLTAAAVKFIQISKEDCMAIFSRDGIVRWWRKGKEYSSIPGIEKHHPLHVGSEASEVLRGRKESAKMVRVPNEAWFPWMRERRGFEVYEQSIRLGNYPTILTLLWVISEN